ncbi:MAG: dTMP kinase [Synergistaceae bacterium]|nr:dTMP kinase [Synergistaceae bacterium]
MFITIEGIDGCGKSTQSERLAHWLTERTGRETIRTFEPGGHPDGEALRRFILESRNYSPKSELLLFLADRAEHTEKVIAPALRDGRNVICERWNESTIAYQSGGHKLELQEVRRLIEACSFPEPDAKIWLDIPPELAVPRILLRTKRDKFEDEGLALMVKVSAAYRELAESGDLMRIDCGDADEAEVFAMITAEIERHLAE